MNVLMSLSARHLRLNRKRTMITIIGIALSVAMVTAISGFIVSLQDMYYRDEAARDGEWHVAFYALDEEAAAAIAADPVFIEAERIDEEDGITLKLMMEKPNKNIYIEMEEMCGKYGISTEQLGYHNGILLALGLLPGGYYESVYTFAGILVALVAVASVMVISNAFSISASERSRQFGILKSVGATKKQIRSMVLWEGAILGAWAIPIGFLIGVLVQWIALTIANYILFSIDGINMMADFRVVLSGWTLAAAVSAALVTIFLAAWLPARRAAKQSAIDAIRQTSEVRVRPRDVRVFPLTGKLFGFEGLLAAKTMKRNRRRYRTTVIALVVSIVLFIGVTSFAQMLLKSTSMVYIDTGANVFVYLYSEQEGSVEQAYDKLSEIENAELYPSRSLTADAEISQDYMNDLCIETMGNTDKMVTLFSLGDETFNEICRSIGLDPTDLSDPENPGAILVNTTGVYIYEGRRYNFTPYKSLLGGSLEISFGEGETESLSIAGEITEIPTELITVFGTNIVTLIVPESVRSALHTDDSYSLQIPVYAADAYDFEDKANEAVENQSGLDSWYITNYESQAESTRNIYMLIMIFIYGFITLLSLISITNVITTISTGISLRRRELAMLRSMGMTSRDITKSLRYESLIYGLKSIVIGLPLGLVVSYAMYHALGGSMTFEYIWPTQSMLISVVAVLLLTIITMSFSSKRLRRETITSALQSEIA